MKKFENPYGEMKEKKIKVKNSTVVSSLTTSPLTNFTFVGDICKENFMTLLINETRNL